MAQYPGNKAGAKFGTGYCDAQCPHDIKFINGEANVMDWTPDPNDPNSGSGHYGTCCVEMDIWEANSMAAAYTPHPCTVEGQTRCEGNDCGDGKNRYGGVCDKDGCDFNSFRMGDMNFLGTGSNFPVDTTKPFTVITQFISSDGTSSGNLTEIRRLYRQNGKVVSNSKVNFPSVPAFDSVTDKMCDTMKTFFGDTNDFTKKGGLSAMGGSLSRGMVLVLSLWDDYAVHMLWLDSNFPTNANPSTPGIARGNCSTDSGDPSKVESQFPNSNVIYSNIRYGDIGTTLH